MSNTGLYLKLMLVKLVILLTIYRTNKKILCFPNALKLYNSIALNVYFGPFLRKIVVEFNSGRRPNPFL